MGKLEVKNKKKKKGRPSLLDLQKRSLKRQRDTQNDVVFTKKNNNASFNLPPLHSSVNYQSAALRRSTRRNPTAPDEEDEEEEEEKEESELNGKRLRGKQKKLKLVVKLPKSESNDGGESENETAASFCKKRKINSIGDGSGESEKGEKHDSATNTANNVEDLGPSTPLPDKKLLEFILERLQKKDTYGAFSEPVDPNELPDYREVIEHPMDFSTIRKKLSGGAYANLEQFEKDVFLICTNAMQYNAPDTIYFRQAHSMQEIAKKNFENLRQDSDNEQEPKQEHKVIKRGRPPTKNLKKPLGRPPLDRAGSEFSSDATLATGGERNIGHNNDLRKGPHLSERSGFADSSGRLNSSCNHTYMSSDNRFERSDEATGSLLRGYAMKHGKKQFMLDENRRNTYKQYHPSAGGREPSVLSTFDVDRKHLMAVGPLSESGYARSLARFAANMGAVAWKIASKRIEKSLLPGVSFGLGWVGENDIPPQRPLLHSSTHPGQPSSHSFPLQQQQQHYSLPPPENLSAAATPQPPESKEDKLSDTPGEDNLSKKPPSVHSASEGHLNNPLPPSASVPPSLPVAVKSEPQSEAAATVERLNSHAASNVLNSSTGAIRARPPFQINQNPVIRPGMNGLNGTYGFNLPGQMNKVSTADRPPGFNFPSSQLMDTISRTNNGNVLPETKNLNAESTKLLKNSSAIKSSATLPKSGTLEASKSGRQLQSPWQGLSLQPKPERGLSPRPKSDAVPPDLNVELQSPASPSTSRVDSTQPDLALQL